MTPRSFTPLVSPFQAQALGYQPQVYPATLYTVYPPEQQYLVIQAPSNAVPYIQSQLQTPRPYTNAATPTQQQYPMSPQPLQMPQQTMQHNYQYQSIANGFPVMPPQNQLQQQPLNTPRRAASQNDVRVGTLIDAPPPSYGDAILKS
jgi:hypothetical protein